MAGNRELLEKAAHLALQCLVIGIGAALALPFFLVLIAPFLGG